MKKTIQKSRGHVRYASRLKMRKRRGEPSFVASRKEEKSDDKSCNFAALTLDLKKNHLSKRKGEERKENEEKKRKC